MAHARELLSVLEDEQPPAPVAAPAATGEPAKAEADTNFPGQPEVEKAIHNVATELSSQMDDHLNRLIQGTMEKEPALKALMGKDSDDEMMAHNDIRLMVIKMLANG